MHRCLTAYKITLWVFYVWCTVLMFFGIFVGRLSCTRDDGLVEWVTVNSDQGYPDHRSKSVVAINMYHYSMTSHSRVYLGGKSNIFAFGTSGYCQLAYHAYPVNWNPINWNERLSAYSSSLFKTCSNAYEVLYSDKMKMTLR